MTNLALVQTDKTEWFRCRPWLEDVIASSGLYDMAAVEQGITDGSMRLWFGENSVAITEILVFPIARVLNVFAVAGPKGIALAELLFEIEPKLCAFARSNNCKKIMGYGIKPQWRPVCEKIGYSHLWTVMAKDV